MGQKCNQSAYTPWDQVLREEQDKVSATENHITHKRHCEWSSGVKKKELDDGLEMLLQNLSKEMRT